MEEQREPDKPEQWLDERQWLSFAIAIATITVTVGTLVFIVWVLQLDNTREMLRRVQILIATMAVGLAGVTFCTVLWRGLISSRQADAQLISTNLQRIQIDKLTEQIATTRENNIALLLQKGAELTSDKDPGKFAAGLATLHAVATGPNEKFAMNAMDLIADAVGAKGFRSHASIEATDAIATLESAFAQSGRKSGRNLRFEDSILEPERSSWRVFDGAASARYVAGEVFLEDVGRKSDCFYYFIDVLFESSTIHTQHFNASGCTFRYCNFKLIGSKTMRESNTIELCDFSDATILPGVAFPDLREGKSFFKTGHPPSYADRREFDFTTVLFEDFT